MMLTLKRSGKKSNSNGDPIRRIRVYGTGSQSFKLVHERVPMVNGTDSPGNDSPTFNGLKTRSLFREISLTIPRWRGTFIIYGVSGKTLEPIDVRSSVYELRTEFREGQKKLSDGTRVDRYSWLVELLSSGTYNEIRIYTSTSV